MGLCILLQQILQGLVLLLSPELNSSRQHLVGSASFTPSASPDKAASSPQALLHPAPLQVKYVVELAKALSRHPAVHRVDLLTRLIRDPKVNASYGKLEEPLTEPVGQLGGAYIARIPCGPVNQYLR